MRQLLSLLLFLSTFTCLSQINYEPGYFINNTGQRTECLIRNVAWKNNPQSFEYKVSEDSETITGTINEVSEFSVANTYKFRRYTVNIDHSPNDVASMSKKKEPEWVEETVFLKVLVEGTITLYEYTDGNLIRFFYSAGGTTEQLVYKPYRTGDAVGYNNQFRGQLYSIMNDKTSGPDKFKNLKYHKDKLVPLFLDYNGTTQKGAGDLSSRQNTTKFNLKFTPGLNLQKLELSQNSIDIIHSIDMESKAVLRIGIEAELVLPFNNNKWALFADPNYQAYKNEGTNVVGDAVETWKVDYKYIEVPLGVRHYMYLGKESKLFLDAAIVVPLNIGDSKAQFTYDGPHSINYTRTAAISRATNFAVGGGFNYDRYSLEVRYNAKRDIMSDVNSWNGNYSSIGLILGYTIL